MMPQGIQSFINNYVTMAFSTNPLARMWKLVKLEKIEIGAIYFYAVLSALIQLTLPVGIQAIISFVLGGAVTASLVLLIILVVGGVLVSGMMQVSQMKLIEKIQQKIFVRYSFDIAARLPRLDVAKADSYYMPELVNRFFDTGTLQKGLSKLLLDVPVATIQVLAGLLLLAFYHPAFIIFGISLLLLLGIMLYFTGGRGLETSLQESNHKYGVAAWLEEIARMIFTFKFLGGSGIHMRKVDENVTGYLTSRTSHFKILLLQFRTLVGFKVVITATLLIVGTLLLVDQKLTIGQFVAAEIIILTVINAVEKLIGNLDSVYDVLTAVDKLGKVTDKEMETEGKYELPVTNKGLSLELRNVGFSYGTTGGPILSNLSAIIKNGEKVCIAGKNGSGKTTLLKLLTGAYSGYSGAILIDGIPLGNYQLETLRSQIGILPGTRDIFAASLWENIVLDNPRITTERVVMLSEKLGLQDYVASLPQGFDTMMDPVGKRLPFSVIQKIKLVRAVAAEPRLLLLEEPWEGMEIGYRERLENLLRNDLPNTTVITASNDAAFMASCDRVIQLDGNVS
jgi:ATP-binding cassette, subfamily B, bacterial